MFDPTSGSVNKGSGCKMFVSFTLSDCLISCPGTFYIEVLVDFLILWPHFPNQAARMLEGPRSMEPPFLSRFVPGVPTGCLE